jgi:hypothetical protein
VKEFYQGESEYLIILDCYLIHVPSVFICVFLVDTEPQTFEDVNTLEWELELQIQTHRNATGLFADVHVSCQVTLASSLFLVVFFYTQSLFDIEIRNFQFPVKAMLNKTKKTVFIKTNNGM